MKRLYKVLVGLMFLFGNIIFSQSNYELNSGWKCKSILEEKSTGEIISNPQYNLNSWKNAVVPGTVLTTQLANNEIPDPFYGMNNKKIPDVYDIGRDYYTYWFVKDFKESKPNAGKQVWLTFRGINYSCKIFINGKLLNKEPFEGMFIRKSFNISQFISENGENRLAVIVYPPYHVGNPNGGQGGDGEIARGLTLQYTAGWDWIRPIRDRNTGIWDKVYIEKTGVVKVVDPHVVTLVLGKRFPGEKQSDATIKTSVELQNTSDKSVTGNVKITFENNIISKSVTLNPNQTKKVDFPDYTLKNPILWWPAGYGDQKLYNATVQFEENNTVSDTKEFSFGVRQIDSRWNETTNSREIYVNGQKIFIKGGNWIVSDAMLRLSKERYDAEIRYHRDMNLNLIRVWGGALLERPEFYEACDKYGILVFQDFWMSGDCNGRWQDAMKKEDQWTRRQYPDNHSLFIESAADMVKMVRNHPSLAIWCGGNEITPPDDILRVIKDSILRNLDSTRIFFPFSNSEEMSFNSIGNNGDGPYGIQDLKVFWDEKTFPFNSEVGSVGVGDYESLQRFIPKENRIVPEFNQNNKPNEKSDSVWNYHNYNGVGYKNFIEKYGKATDVKDFCKKAQLVNFDQYRGLIEGFSSHMWQWYTGVIIWKTQNPWTSMRGQMYDCYLDPNACLYGLKSGSEMLHSSYNPVDGMVMITNNAFTPKHNILLSATWYDISGKESLLTQMFYSVGGSISQKCFSIKNRLDKLASENGGFLRLKIQGSNKEVLSDNLYWIADKNGVYSGLINMRQSKVKISAKYLKKGNVEVLIKNPENNPISFFNRISVENKNSGKRILPAFYSDNYISVEPGEERRIEIEFLENQADSAIISVSGWNLEKETVEISK